MTRAKLMVAAFCVTQTVGYGVLFYVFSVFVTPMAVDLGAGPAAITGAMTLCILVTGVAALPVGRWIDRRGGRWLMTGGSVLGTAAVLAWSQVRTVWQLYAVFAAIGLASAAVLYEAAFAVIVKRVRPRERPTSILAVTIVAGFASTVFMPLAGLLGERWGWRWALVALAAIYGVLTIFPHAYLVPAKVIENDDHHGPRAGVRAAMGDRVFWLVAIAFTANGAAMSAVSIHLVSYLLRLGHPISVAATLAGLLGVMSVTGRLVTTRLAMRLPTAGVVASAYLLQGMVILLLSVVGRARVGAIACIVLFGLGFGLASIARPAILADRYGATFFGAIAGATAIPITVAKAAAPLAVVAVSLSSLPIFAAAGCLVAAICLLAVTLSHPAWQRSLSTH